MCYMCVYTHVYGLLLIRLVGRGMKGEKATHKDALQIYIGLLPYLKTHSSRERDSPDPKCKQKKSRV